MIFVRVQHGLVLQTWVKDEVCPVCFYVFFFPMFLLGGFVLPLASLTPCLGELLYSCSAALLLGKDTLTTRFFCQCFFSGCFVSLRSEFAMLLLIPIFVGFKLEHFTILQRMFCAGIPGSPQKQTALGLRNPLHKVQKC